LCEHTLVRLEGPFQKITNLNTNLNYPGRTMVQTNTAMTLTYIIAFFACSFAIAFSIFACFA